MPLVTVIRGELVKTIEVAGGTLLGEAITRLELPLEQPCAGRGTCGLCKILIEEGAAPPDEIERQHLTPGELAVRNRLACRARVAGDTRVLLAPVVVYSNKAFKASARYKRERDVPLGLAIDLGSTTVAAFLTMLDNGEVAAGGASLNQQTVYGADVISRLAAALHSPADRERLHRLALASINQAVDALKLSDSIRKRIVRVTVVGNVAMHHLLSRLPVDTIAVKPFQPYRRESVHDAGELLGGIFPPETQIMLPPLIGGFVGSDALACLASLGFAAPLGPIAAVDLGTNGEVLVTNGERILAASTAAGPAFEGVNISCGTRAVDGAVIGTRIKGGDIQLTTIGDEPPIGLTGSGLMSIIHELRKAGVIEPSGRILADPPIFGERLGHDERGARTLTLTQANGSIALSQWDVREFQKAKAAIRAAIDTLMLQLNLRPDDLQQMILTGSFGSQLDPDAVLGLGLIPPVARERVHAVANGAGLGAAIFLSDEGFALGEQLAERAQQIDLDRDPAFYQRFIDAMALEPGSSGL